MKAMAQLLQRLSQRDNAAIFNSPVSALEYPDYHQIVPHAMDLGTILAKIQEAQYPSLEACAKDVRRVWTNAYLYNPEGSIVADAAQKLSKVFENMYNKINPDDFNYEREPNIDERQKFSRDIYRVEDSQLAEALDMLEARYPEGVIRNNEEGYVVVKVDSLPSPVFWAAELFLRSRLCNQPERTKKKIPTTFRATPEYVARIVSSVKTKDGVTVAKSGNSGNQSNSERRQGANSNGGVTSNNVRGNTAPGSNVAGASSAGDGLVGEGRRDGSAQRSSGSAAAGGTKGTTVDSNGNANRSAVSTNSTGSNSAAQNTILGHGAGSKLPSTASSIGSSKHLNGAAADAAGRRHTRDNSDRAGSMITHGGASSRPRIGSTVESAGRAGGVGDRNGSRRDNLSSSRSSVGHGGVEGGSGRAGHATGWVRGPADTAYREGTGSHSKRQKVHGSG